MTDPEWLLEARRRFDALVESNLRREREAIEQRWREAEQHGADLRSDPSPTR
jgi:hypothetical protein